MLDKIPGFRGRITGEISASKVLPQLTSLRAERERTTRLPQPLGPDIILCPCVQGTKFMNCHGCQVADKGSSARSHHGSPSVASLSGPNGGSGASSDCRRPEEPAFLPRSLKFLFLLVTLPALPFPHPPVLVAACDLSLSVSPLSTAAQTVALI
jgi:hypothetical protein